jgi:transcriptional regulator with XRE-family HTH domain
MNIQDRIKMVITMHNLTSSAFADKIGVQRSSVSHILTGRNNPSLDFIEKTLRHFPRVNADWLILGKSPNSNNNVDEQHSTLDTSKSQEQAEYSTTKKELKAHTSRAIERIIVFYTDGTFEETLPSERISAQ